MRVGLEANAADDLLIIDTRLIF
jgi:hypothetical protein